MSVDQDLSGDMVKIVQFAIVSIATNETDTARLLYGPRVVVFGDDMTAADFTAWILSEYRLPVTQNAARIRYCQKHGLAIDLEQRRIPDGSRRLPPVPSSDPLLNPKWHRVAFQVISRFAPVDIDWSRDQAAELAQLANSLTAPEPVRIAGQDAASDRGEPGGLDSAPARASGPQRRNET